MKRQERWILAFMTLALSACTVGPDYRPPQIELPTTYKGESLWQEVTSAEAGTTAPWWESYHDPELNRLEALALGGSPTLQAVSARLEQARASAGLARADSAPQVELNPLAQRSRKAGDFSSGGTATTGNFFSLPFDLAYEVDLWGRVRRANEAAQAGVVAAEEDGAAAALALSAEVARNYFQLRAVDQEEEILRRTIELRVESRRMINSRYQAGQSGLVDLSRADTELANARAELSALVRGRAELENSLALLVGQPASSFALSPGSLPAQPPNFRSGVPSTLLERRPDIAAARQRLIAANARIGVSKAAFFPTLRLFGSAGFQSSAAGRLVTADNLVWAFGPAATLPIFDGGSNRARLRFAEAGWDEAVAGYRQQVLNGVREVEDGLSGLFYLGEQLGYLEAAAQAARQSEELSRKRYAAGSVSYLEVVDAERTSLVAERQAVRVRGERLEVSARLGKALGGGWEEGLPADRL